MIKIKGLRWWMISLIMLGSVINYLTRSTLAVAAPTVLKELHISTQQYSWIVGAFQGAIMAQPVCGYVLDVLGLKAGFAIFAVVWAPVQMAHSLANSWKTFPREREMFTDDHTDAKMAKAALRAGASHLRRPQR